MEDAQINSLIDRLSKPCKGGCLLNESSLPFNPYIDPKYISELDNAILIALPKDKSLTFSGNSTIIQLSGSASYNGRVITVPENVYSLCHVHHSLVTKNRLHSF